MKQIIIMVWCLFLFASSIFAQQPGTTLNFIDNPAPTILIVDADDPTDCGGNDGHIQISAVPTPVTYLWDNGANTATLNNLVADTYEVEVTLTSTGCKADTSITLAGVSTPVITDQPDGDILCAGEPLSLSITATGSDLTYQWSKDGVDIVDATAATYSVTFAVYPTDGGTYQCQVSSGNCYTNSNNAMVTVKPSPTVNVQDLVINYPSSATLTTSGGTYLWNTGATTASITVSPDEETSYSVTVTGTNGCSTVDQATVFVNGGPLTLQSVTTSPSSGFICSGQSATITAIAADGDLPYSYHWSTGANTQSITVQPTLATTNYGVTITDANGEQVNGTATINIWDAIANANAVQTVIQYGDTAFLQASTQAWSSYEWSSNYGFYSTDQNPMDFPSWDTWYYLTVTNSIGCTATDSLSIVVLNQPLQTIDDENGYDITSSAGMTIHVNESTDLSVNVTGGTPPYTYAWSSGGTSSSETVTESVGGTYTYTVTISDSGTKGSIVRSITLTVLSWPEAEANFGTIGSQNQTICTGDSAYFDVYTSGHYPLTIVVHNDATATNTSISVPSSPYTMSFAPTTGTTATSYTYSLVSVTDADGLAGEIIDGGTYVNVLVNPLPAADAGLATSVCLGSSVNLTATGGGTYQWETLQAISTISVSPAATTYYTVTVTLNSCTRSDSVQVTVNSLPLGSAGNDVTICEASSINLAATGAGTLGSYLWSTTQTSASISVTPTTTTTYYVTVTNVNQCVDMDTVIVTVDPAITLAMTASDNPICNEQQTTITCGVSPYVGPSFSWSGMTEISQSVIVTPASTTTYSVVVTQGVCQKTATTTITVHQTPTVSLGNDQPICEGEAANLTATINGGAMPYAYDWSTGDNASAIAPTPLISGDYMVTVTDANGCEDMDTIHVTVNSIPVIAISGNAEICNGQSTTLTVAGASDYLWSTTATAASITPSPTANTTYFVTGTDANNCTATDQLLVVVNQLPSASAGNDTTVCAGNSVVLTASGGTTYIWSTGSANANLTVNNVQTTETYNVTVTDANNCSAPDQVTIWMLPLPTVVAGQDQSICVGESVQLSATITGATSISWNNSSSLSNAAIFNPVATPSATTTYTITVDNTNGNGCVVTDQVQVAVNPLPVITANDVSDCAGSPIQLSAQNTGMGVAIASWAWLSDNGTFSDDNIANPTITTNVDAVATVTATSTAGCQDMASIQVTAIQAPVADFMWSLIDGQTVNFVNLSSDMTSCVWDLYDTTITSTAASFIHTYNFYGSVNVLLTVTGQCGTDEVQQTVIGLNGIEETAAEGAAIQIYPNPVRDILILSGIENAEYVQLTDALGQVLTTSDVRGEQLELSFSNLASGIYYINITTKQGHMVTSKVIKL